MSHSQYSLAWDSFKSNICSGFSALQQNGEFVDMTLAADGHFVKVHQVLVALSSTYLKNLIASAPCQHPVIFLNNVSHKVLCYLLEYIYTGEVLVPSEYLPTFTDAAKDLQIKGLENLNNVDCQISRNNTISSTVDNFEMSHISSLKRKKANPAIKQTILPQNARKAFVKPEGALMTVNNMEVEPSNDSNEFISDMMEDSGAQHSDEEFKQECVPGPPVDIHQVKANPTNLLYTVSIRGSLQAILNRYIYNQISTATRTGVRRWRCVEYRNNKCNAFVVTKGNLVVKRSNLHNHAFHDKKILSKIEKKAVFSAIDDVEAYREKEKTMDEEDTVEEDNYTLDHLKEDAKSE